LWSNNVIAPSPVWLGDGRIFVTAGYGAGSMMLKIKTEGDRLSLESLQKVKPVEGLASEQQTPVFYKGRLFGILPKDAGPMRNQFVCCHPENIADFTWSSGKTNRFGLGPYIVAGGKFYILDDKGVLTVLKASAEEYIQLGRAKVLDGADAWGPLAIAGGRLLARDSRKMVCIDLRTAK
jgi:outer membrane protein assembly factor BamB